MTIDKEKLRTLAQAVADLEDIPEREDEHAEAVEALWLHMHCHTILALLAEAERLKKFEDWFVRLDQAEQSLSQSFKAECDKLRAELAGLRTGYDTQNQVIAELRSDAARYEWAISRIERVEILSSVVICHDGNTDKINERIDAYMESGNGDQ